MTKGLRYGNDGLDLWFSTFRMLWPFNTAPHVVVILNYNIIFVVTS